MTTAVRSDEVLNSGYIFYLPSFNDAGKIWSRLDKTSSLLRNILNTAAKDFRVISRMGTEFPRTVSNITTHMKVCNVAGVPFCLNDTNGALNAVHENYKNSDNFGTFLDFATFTLVATDAFDTIATVVNSSLVATSNAPIKLLSDFGLPAAYFMVSIGTILKVISIARACKLYANISGKTEDFTTFVQDQLGAHVTEKVKNENAHKAREF